MRQERQTSAALEGPFVPELQATTVPFLVEPPQHQQMSHASIAIGPIRISHLTMPQLVKKLISHCFGDKTKHVVTANAQFYVLAQEDPEFRECVNQADYVCADGISVVVACKWLRSCSVARVAGVDLIPALCEAAEPLGHRVFFLGGNEGTAARTATLMAALYPRLQIAGISCPPAGFLRRSDQLQEILEELKNSRPAIVFVALGAPRQEHFIRDYIRPLNIPVAVGVGGSFDIIAGTFKRAPLLIQKVGLEWAFRWIQEPRRLARRYLVGNTLFVYYFVRNLLGDDRSTKEV